MSRSTGLPSGRRSRCTAGGSTCRQRKEIREAAKLAAGKRAHVTLEADTAARTVMVPSDLAKALASEKLRPAFDALSFTRRKEHVASVTEAKHPETRAARVAKVVKSLRSQ